MQKRRSITQNRNIYSFTHLPAVFSAFIFESSISGLTHTDSGFVFFSL